MQVFIAVIALAAVAVADNRPAYNAPSYNYPDTDPVYNFGYNVYNNGEGYDNQNFRQNEDRNGYETHGEYSVLLPDGRTQIVTYQVNGDSGFIADVRYEGEARYDTYKPHPKPAYKPKPTYAPAKPAYVPVKPVYVPAPTYAPKPKPTYAPKPAPTYAPKPAPTYAPKREYGPVRFNPFG